MARRTQQAVGIDRPRPVPHTRAAGAWVALAACAVALLAMLIFILQNGQSSKIHFLGANGSLPMGVALLLAAVFGVLLASVAATIRITQLRHLAVRRDTPVRPDPVPAAPDHAPNVRAEPVAAAPGSFTPDVQPVTDVTPVNADRPERGDR